MVSEGCKSRWGPLNTASYSRGPPWPRVGGSGLVQSGSVLVSPEVRDPQTEESCPRGEGSLAPIQSAQVRNATDPDYNYSEARLGRPALSGAAPNTSAPAPNLEAKLSCRPPHHGSLLLRPGPLTERFTGVSQSESQLKVC